MKPKHFQTYFPGFIVTMGPILTVATATWTWNCGFWVGITLCDDV
jgi:hypothetical protein